MLSVCCFMIASQVALAPNDQHGYDKHISCDAMTSRALAVQHGDHAGKQSDHSARDVEHQQWQSHAANPLLARVLL